MENNIGKYVQRERKKKGMTQEQLAERTGISWSAISRFETGQSMLSVERILKIVETLDIGIESVFCDYVKVMPDAGDDTTREILRMLSICTPAEKRYLLENLKLLLEYLHLQPGQAPAGMDGSGAMMRICRERDHDADSG